MGNPDIGKEPVKPVTKKIVNRVEIQLFIC